MHVVVSERPEDFIDLQDLIPDVLVNLRYAGPHNFTGRAVPGYRANRALMTRRAAQALARVQARAKREGFCLVIYDTYRPQKACDAFVAWQKEPENIALKALYHPYLSKKQIFEQKYIVPHSTHSRGSTVDLTLIRLVDHDAFQKRTKPFFLETRIAPSGEPYLYQNDGTLDMGGHFDYFGERSLSEASDITPEQSLNRKRLRTYMEAEGFRPLFNEWWHFTFENEPYPKTYFNFDM
jgi:D-alanyl-D-alanine dipeptidase